MLLTPLNIKEVQQHKTQPANFTSSSNDKKTSLASVLQPFISTPVEDAQFVLAIID